MYVKEAAKITLAQLKCETFRGIICPAEEKAYVSKQHFGMRKKSCKPTDPFYYKKEENTVQQLERKG